MIIEQQDLQRRTQDPPVGRSDPPATWAAVTSRRPLQNVHIPTDDSYPDVRVSSLRHHNWDFPTAPRDAIFVLATTTFDALEDVGRSKFSLGFALDLALKTPSPLLADIVNGTIELCELAQHMYNARYASKWYSTCTTPVHVEMIRNISLQRHDRPSERACPTETSFRTGPRTPSLHCSPSK